MGIRPKPPASLVPETGDIDDDWDDVIGSAFADPPPKAAPAPPAPAGRVASPPRLTPSGLELSDPSEPPPKITAARSSDPMLALSESAPPAPALEFEPSSGDEPSHIGLTSERKVDASFDRRRTAPEPLVERAIERIEAGRAAPADRLNPRPGSRELELGLDTAGESPLELVEMYRRVVESAPNEPVVDKEALAGSETLSSGTLRDLQDRYAVGDFTGALVVAESILDAHPEDAEAKRYAQSCREVLTQMYAARLGPMDQVATVAVPTDQITWLSLDHRAGFLLSLVDGVSSMEEILDISGMSRLDALRILYTLVQQNVVTLA